MARKSGLAALMSGQPLPAPPKRRFFNKKKLRTFLIHSGLVFLCMLYITLGAVLFYSLERPIELDMRDKTIEALKVEQEILMKVSASMNDNFDDFEAFNSSIAPLLDEYQSALFEMFRNPISANVFESMVFHNSDYVDMWTPSSSVLFAATTMVPVGFGLITPTSSLGKLLLICYAIIGIPLALVTTSDLGKFFCLFMYKLLNESMKASMAIFIILLILYPFGGGIIISLVSDMTWIDSVYYCIMTIFTIGYGDFQPPIPVVFLIIFIVVGVTLVTVSIEVVGSNIIHHIHYMGRQMGRAKEIAGKMMQIAQKLSINRGLGLGMAQLGAFAKFGMMMRVDSTHHNGQVVQDEDSTGTFRSRKDTAFEPEIHIDFVDGFSAF